MNKTKLNNLVVVTFLVTSVFYTSCKDKEIIKTESTKIYTNASSTTGEGAEKLMEFAPPTENPYTISNMQRALDTLSMQIKSKSDLKFFDIRTTHKYIKFKPQDSLQLWALNSDTTLILFDYPLDRKIAHAGTYYRDPSVPEGQPNFQWTAVPVDKKLPEGIPFEVLEELYIPEEDQKLVPYYNTLIDDHITELTDIALKITGNFDSTEMKEVAEEDIRYKWRRRSKWNPSGRIQMWDDALRANRPIKGCQVRARRWFTMRSMYTNSNGEFWTPHQFRRDVNYSVKWDRNDFEIRHKRTGQAYFNGPKIKGAWNLTITSGYSRMYAIIHRAAHRYYYEGPAARAGLRTPPKKNTMLGKVTIGAFHWQNTSILGRCNMFNRWTTGPEIKIFHPQNNCEQLFATTIHELAHSSHWNLSSHSDYNQADGPVKEGWARGVQWAITRLEYSNYQGGGVNRPNYTEVVMDMIDTRAMEIFPGNTGWNIWEGDSVSSYTIRQIENSLVGERDWDDWKDAIKDDHNNATENELDELFDNWD